MTTYYCYLPDSGEQPEDAHLIDAHSPEAAVRYYARWLNNESGGEWASDHLKHGSEGFVVKIITKLYGGDHYSFRVYPEPDIIWHAVKL